MLVSVIALLAVSRLCIARQTQKICAILLVGRFSAFFSKLFKNDFNNDLDTILL